MKTDPDLTARMATMRRESLQVPVGFKTFFEASRKDLPPSLDIHAKINARALFLCGINRVPLAITKRWLQAIIGHRGCLEFYLRNYFRSVED